MKEKIRPDFWSHYKAIPFCFLFLSEYLGKGAPFAEGGYNDLDPGLNPALQDHYRITPSPGGPGDQYGTFLSLEHIYICYTYYYYYIHIYILMLSLLLLLS